MATYRGKSVHQQIVLWASLWTRLKSRWYYPAIFGRFGARSLLFAPAVISRPEFIWIGKSVLIRNGSRLEVVPIAPSRVPELRIGDSVNIEQNVHIVCHHRVTIGDRVSITANCAIIDTTHPFDDIAAHEKVGNLVQDDEGFVEIGEGSFLGIGCVVLPNVRIGKGCVIGANSVVTRSIPDFSVAAGAPAVVLRAIRKLPAV